MSGFVQLPFGSLCGDYEPSAFLRQKPRELTESLGIEWTQYHEDGIGPSLGADFETAEGEQFCLSAYPFPVPSHPERRTAILTILQSLEEADVIDAALSAFQLTSADLSYLRDDLHFMPHELIRQDDHGNQFCVGTYSCRADALAAEREFRRSFHKQEYWIRRKD